MLAYFTIIADATSSSSSSWTSSYSVHSSVYFKHSGMFMIDSLLPLIASFLLLASSTKQIISLIPLTLKLCFCVYCSKLDPSHLDTDGSAKWIKKESRREKKRRESEFYAPMQLSPGELLIQSSASGSGNCRGKRDTNTHTAKHRDTNDL